MVVRRRMGRSNVVFKNNKIVKCGTSEKSGKACRPLIRINKDTPITIPELLKIHTKSKLLKLVEMKKKYGCVHKLEISNI